MSADVYLQGSESVARAGREIASAAETMRMAASSFNEDIHRLINAMNEFTARFEDAATKVADAGDKIAAVAAAEKAARDDEINF